MSANQMTIRAKRGMVFWYDQDPRVNKNDVPPIIIDGKPYHDFRQYGPRQWLVVSNDKGNESSPTCNIVPITCKETKARIPVHVSASYQGTPITILCEAATTVNSVMLREYCFQLSEPIMQRVDEALRIQFGIHKPEPDMGRFLKKAEARVQAMAEEKLAALCGERNIPEEAVKTAAAEIAAEFLKQVEGDAAVDAPQVYSHKYGIRDGDAKNGIADITARSVSETDEN